MLTSQQRRAAIALLVMMLLGMALEMIGVGVVVPALALIARADIATQYPFLAPLVRRLGNPGQEQVIVAGVAGLILVYAIKTLFLSLLAWRQMKFVNDVQADVSRRLFSGYMAQPYVFHLRNNSAQLIRNAIGETNVLTQTGLMAGLNLLTELLVAAGIVVLLLFVEPWGALLALGILAVPAWMFHRFTNRRITQWGQARQMHEGMRIQHLQQGLGGAKEVKLLGRERDFLSEYERHTSAVARVQARQQTLQQFPRLGFEFFAVCGLAVLVMAMVEQGKPVESLLPTLGLFAAAAFRILPSANRVVSALQNVRYGLPVIDTLHAHLTMLESEEHGGRTPEPMQFRRAIELSNVRFSYSPSSAPALDGVSLEIPHGSSVGLIGGSGAGKSTLVDIILGLLEPEHGAVLVDGEDIHSNLRGWQNKIGYVPQSVYLTDDTLRRNVAFGLAEQAIDEDAVWKALRAAQLAEFVESLPEGLDTAVGERGVRLSGGQLQRIGIARALYHDPPVLVLDEATSSLDVETERGIVNSVRALHGSKTIIIVAHRMSTVEHCDFIYELQNGRVVNAGPPAVVLPGTRRAAPAP